MGLCANSRRPSIFAIHGLNPRSKDDATHAWDTWRTPAGPQGHLWLRDDLPQYIPDARIFIYEYNSTAVYGKDKDTFVGKANELLESIRIKRPDRAESRPILFLGHSLGGLLIKQALINAHNNPKYTPIKEATTGLAFFATPHNGGDWKLLSLGYVAAKIAVATGIQQGDDILETLKKGSIFSDIMQEQFRQQLMKYDIISFWGAWDNVVPPESARLGMPGDRENVVKLNADHSGICKFGASQADQDNLEFVQFNIKDIYKKALQKPASGFHGWTPDHHQPGSYPGPPPPQQGAAGTSTPQPPPLPPRFAAPPPSHGKTPDVGAQAAGTQRITGVAYEPTSTDARSLQVAGHKNAGRWEQARQLEQHMMNEYHRTLGTAHRTSLAAAYDYTATTINLGYLEEASRWADWTFQTSSSALGPKDPVTLKVNRIRGVVLNIRGQHQEAENILAGTLVEQQDLLGDDHPDTLETVKELAMLWRTMGRVKDAETRLQHRMETMTRILGENHIRVADAAMDLLSLALHAQRASHHAASFFGNSQFGQVAMLIDDIHRRLRDSVGPQNQVTIRALKICGEVRLTSGETTAASDMLRRALSNAESLLGPDHPETMAVVCLMAALCSRQDGGGGISFTTVSTPTMRPWLERYATWLEQHLGLNIPETRQTLNLLGLSYMSEKKYYEAERYYERLVQSYGGVHSKAAQDANQMYQLCRMNTSLNRRAAGGGADLAGLFSKLGFLGK